MPKPIWHRMRSRQLGGHKFVRQEAIGPYTVDLVCRERRVVVEVDGGQHAGNNVDVVRDRWLKEHGYTVLRFWNNDVLRNCDGVLQMILQTLEAVPPLTRFPPPAETDLSPQAGRGEMPGDDTAFGAAPWHTK